jgi:hypothetical protein
VIEVVADGLKRNPDRMRRDTVAALVFNAWSKKDELSFAGGKDPSSQTLPRTWYPSRAMGPFANITIRLGITPEDFIIFSRIGFNESGAVELVNGRKRAFGADGITLFLLVWWVSSSEFHTSLCREPIHEIGSNVR